jgi:hypothetical protein
MNTTSISNIEKIKNFILKKIEKQYEKTGKKGQI